MSATIRQCFLASLDAEKQRPVYCTKRVGKRSHVSVDRPALFPENNRDLGGVECGQPVALKIRVPARNPLNDANTQASEELRCGDE